MPKVRVNSFSVSLDGHAAGPNQSLENPLGVRGPELFEWFFSTRTWKQMHGYEGGSTGVDNEWAQRGMENAGAWILGRNMFGPVRGPWPDDSWKGWWGEEPPYHVPTFVLTHHPRQSVETKGGTTFHFVTDGIHDALQQAKDAAKDKDVRIGGGVATIQQYLRARLIDELYLALRPILMGSGENLFEASIWQSSGIVVRSMFPRSSRCTSSLRRTHNLEIADCTSAAGVPERQCVAQGRCRKTPSAIEDLLPKCS